MFTILRNIVSKSREKCRCSHADSVYFWLAVVWCALMVLVVAWGVRRLFDPAVAEIECLGFSGCAASTGAGTTLRPAHHRQRAANVVSMMQSARRHRKSMSPAAPSLLSSIHACPAMEFERSFVPYAEFVKKQSSSSSSPAAGASGGGVLDRAYVAFASSDEFGLPAAVLMYSIARTGSKHARVLCVTKSVSPAVRDVLAEFAQVIEVDSVPSPHFIRHGRYLDVFTKLRLWQLTMFKKIVYIDVDVIVTRNIDDLFDTPAWGVPMDAETSRYSTGMMVIEPSLKTYDAMRIFLLVTNISMELPDLLFLQEFFDSSTSQPTSTSTNTNANSAGGGINLFPRWYQVYQEEFGRAKRTYMTAGEFPLTIFDERIRGIHFPGPNKPWLGDGGGGGDQKKNKKKKQKKKRSALTAALTQRFNREYAGFACLFGESSTVWASLYSAGLIPMFIASSDGGSGVVVSSASSSQRIIDLWFDPHFAWYSMLALMQRSVALYASRTRIFSMEEDKLLVSSLKQQVDGTSPLWKRLEIIASRIQNKRAAADQLSLDLYQQMLLEQTRNADEEARRCSNRGYLQRVTSDGGGGGVCRCYRGYTGAKCEAMLDPDLVVIVTASHARHRDYNGEAMAANLRAAANLTYAEAKIKAIEMLFVDGTRTFAALPPLPVSSTVRDNNNNNNNNGDDAAGAGGGGGGATIQRASGGEQDTITNDDYDDERGYQAAVNARGGEAGIRIEVHASTAQIAHRIRSRLTPELFEELLRHTNENRYYYVKPGHYCNFAKNEPNNANDGENYLQLNLNPNSDPQAPATYSDFGITDTTDKTVCEIYFPFLSSSNKQDHHHHHHNHHHNNNRVFFVLDHVVRTWHEARAACESYELSEAMLYNYHLHNPPIVVGGPHHAAREYHVRLPRVYTASDDLKQLTLLLAGNGDGIWLGGTDEGNEGHFRWEPGAEEFCIYGSQIIP